MTTVDDAKSLIVDLCSNFYAQGWVSGTGGGISIKSADGRVVMAPSGVQKERMLPSDMFVLDAETGAVVDAPRARPPPYRPPKLSECAPLFMAAYELRGAGAVIHSHSPASVLATMLDPSADRFTVTHLEMIKGIEGHGFYGECVVPIIENTARECELTGRLRDAIARFPRANAVLVRRHGVYVWGRDWVQAKTQAECYDYLFDAAVRMAALGIDASRPPAPLPLPAAAADGEAAAAAAANGNGNGNGASAGADADADADAAPPAAKRPRPPPTSGPLAAAAHGAPPTPLGPHSRRRLPKAIVLDIEGTVSPLAFVAETMRPYCSPGRLRAHLEATYASAQTRADLELVRRQADEDAAAGKEEAGGGVPAPFPDPEAAPRDAVVAAAVAWASAASAADRKVPALKALQGRVWRGGFQSGELVAQLFRDVPDALAEWRDAHGIKTYIYSSGSREAQRLFFAHTQVGDLRPYLCGFFDPAAVGPKGMARSYEEIRATLGLDDARADLVFATDAVAEAAAARAAGWRAVLVAREGNPPLEAGAAARFPVVTTMAGLLEAAAEA